MCLHISQHSIHKCGKSQASHNWFCCQAIPSIVDEDKEVIFYALHKIDDFKVRFIHCILIIVNIFSANRVHKILHKMFGVLSMSGI